MFCLRRDRKPGSRGRGRRRDVSGRESLCECCGSVLAGSARDLFDGAGLGMRLTRAGFWRDLQVWGWIGREGIGGVWVWVWFGFG